MPLMGLLGPDLAKGRVSGLEDISVEISRTGK